MPVDIVPPTIEVGDVGQTTKGIFDYLISPELQQILFPLKLVFIGISVIFFVVVVYLLVRTTFVDWWFLRFLRNFLFPKIIRQKALIQRWKKIKKGLTTDIEAQWKTSLIEASLFLNEILRDAGYSGKNLDERLQQLNEEDFPNLKELRQAQAICRDIARDPDYKLDKKIAGNSLDEFERALQLLDIL